MRLKRLELFGFKSFADRTVLDFGSNTLTGIVGPNGCGKSNVVDSVRWVLGETRPSSLRGAGMIDVIFKGSASRPSLSVADVTLILDNECETIEGRGPEVAITRRLYRSGEGEYLIDGEKVRLRDLRDMLYDTGLGSRGYSVLEQGKIDAILSANAVQRRSIFEEAAGISRYRQRRHEAELRLKRVDLDVVRLDDMMGELRTRVRSLKIQAGKAERYVEAKGEWTLERARLFKHRMYEVTVGLAEVGPELAQLELDLEQQRGERGELELEMGRCEDERAGVVGELDRLSGEAGRVAGEVRALEERRLQLGLRIQAWETSSQEELQRAEELSVSLAERRTELGKVNDDCVDLENRSRESEAHAGSLAGRFKELNRGYKEVRVSVGEQNDIVLSKLHEKTAAQNRVRHLEDSQAPAGERFERVADRLSGMQGAMAEVQSEAERARSDSESARDALTETDARRQSCSTRLDEAEYACEAAREEQNSLKLDRARLSARIESLLDRKTELEDLGSGTRRVLEAIAESESQHGENAGGIGGPCDSERLAGIVADHLLTDTRLARALDVLLAERASALVAKAPADARAVVDWLREGGEGQVGVVVPGALGSRPQRPLPDFEGEAEGAVEGRLYDLVQCAPEAEPLARALLSDAIVVRDLDTAMRLVALHPEWRFVTPFGDLVDAAGLVGGHREVTQGVVGRRSSAAELETQVRAKDIELTDLTHRLEDAITRRDALRIGLRELTSLREERARLLAEVESNKSTAEARLVDLSSSFTVLEQEKRQAAEEMSALRGDLQGAQEEREHAEHSFEEENQRLSQMESGRRELEDERERLSRDEGRAQVESTRLRGELSQLRQRMDELERRIAEDDVEIAEARRRSAEYLSSAGSGGEDDTRLSGDETRMQSERTVVDERLVELRLKESGGRERIDEVRQRVDSLQSYLDKGSDQLSERRLAQQRFELSREDILRRADEELSMEEADLIQDFRPEEEVLADPSILEALERHTSELRSRLDKLGPVNVEAVTELEEVGGRLDFLETQNGDLSQARAMLRETINKIDEESRKLFLETFDEVRGNFQRIFRQLFGGGRAEISLEADVDVLDAGIEITARPPGREMLSIGLLSGGQRTMTALALLFAVFEARPSPFCVLDEVDAALDDANIDRFLGMLEGFRQTTQFIVVTHNKGTMATCEALYGVTMETKGVSRFVAVELSEAEEFAPQAKAGEQPQSDGDQPQSGGDQPQSGVERGEGSPDDDGRDDPGGDDPAPEHPQDPEMGGDAIDVDAESGEPVVELMPVSNAGPLAEGAEDHAEDPADDLTGDETADEQSMKSAPSDATAS